MMEYAWALVVIAHVGTAVVPGKPYDTVESCMHAAMTSTRQNQTWASRLNPTIGKNFVVIPTYSCVAVSR